MKLNKLQEDIEDIFTDKITAQRVQQRKIRLERVAKMTEVAIAAAERKGQEANVKRLRDKLNEINQAINSATDNLDAEDDDTIDTTPADQKDKTKQNTTDNTSQTTNNDGEPATSEEPSHKNNRDGAKKSTTDQQNNEEESDASTTKKANAQEPQAPKSAEELQNEQDIKDLQNSVSNSANIDNGGTQSSSGGSGDNKSHSDKEGSEGQPGQDDEDEGGDEGGGGGSNKIDPFKKNIGGRGQGPQPQNQETLGDALIRIFSTLKGDARRGALDAIEKVDADAAKKLGYGGLFTKNKQTESLQESLKSLQDMSDDEFSDLINSTLDEIDKVIKVNYSSDLDTRITQIKSDMSNPIKNRELTAEDARNTAEEHKNIQTIKAGNSFNDRKKKFSGINIFKINFYRAIKNQVELIETESDSWSALNKKFEDEKSILVRGQQIDDKYDDAKPLIEIYFDQSNSFDQKDINAGMAAVNVIQEFEDSGDIKIDYYFFAENVFTTPVEARAQTNTLAWNEILTNIKAHKAKNVVIITDDDMDWDAKFGESLTLDGCVYYLWRNGKYSDNMPQKLRGREGTFQYEITVK